MLVQFVFDIITVTIHWPKHMPMPRPGDLLDASLFNTQPKYDDILKEMATGDGEVLFISWHRVENNIIPQIIVK